MTVRELHNEFYKLENDFYKIVNNDEETEAIRWILKTQEFLYNIIDNAETVKTLTEDEEKTLAQTREETKISYIKLLKILQDRIRKE